MLSVLPIQYNIGCWFFINSFYYFEIRSINTEFVEVFSIKCCWILSNAFSVSIEIIMWFLFLVLFMGWIMFIDLCMLNQPCIPRINPTWSWWISLSMCCCNQLASILLKIFVSMISSWILAWSFLFLLSICRVLVSGWCWSHKMIWERFPLFGLFRIVSEGMVTVPLRVCGRIRLWTHLDLGFFCVVGS